MKIQRENAEQEIRESVFQLEEDKIKFIQEQKQKISKLQAKLGEVTATSKNICKQKLELLEEEKEGESPDKQLGKLKDGQENQDLIADKDLAKEIDEREPLDELDKEAALKREKIVEALEKEESLAIKAIERQLLDANRILLDINTKIKDVFEGD